MILTLFAQLYVSFELLWILYTIGCAGAPEHFEFWRGKINLSEFIGEEAKRPNGRRVCWRDLVLVFLGLKKSSWRDAGSRLLAFFDPRSRVDMMPYLAISFSWTQDFELTRMWFSLSRLLIPRRKSFFFTYLLPQIRSPIMKNRRHVYSDRSIRFRIIRQPKYGGHLPYDCVDPSVFDIVHLVPSQRHSDYTL